MKHAFAPFILFSPIHLLAQGTVPQALPPVSSPPLPTPNPAAAMDELRDIAPPVDIPFWTTGRQAGAVLAGVIVLVLLVWAVRAWMRRTRPLPAAPDPLAVALGGLAKLSEPEALGLSPKDFAASVADVIRRFLEAKHGFEAPRQTTEEFLETAKSSNRFASVVQDQLGLFLGKCDALKFSRVGSLGDARQDLLTTALKLVREDLA